MVKEDTNLKSALCYIPGVGLVVAIVLLVLESDNHEIKWHALQALIFGISAALVSFAFAVTGVLAFVAPLINIAAFVIQLVLLVKTYQGKKVMLPVISEWVGKLIK